jgi:tRNA G46 methylase TrmB
MHKSKNEKKNKNKTKHKRRVAHNRICKKKEENLKQNTTITINVDVSGTCQAGMQQAIIIIKKQLKISKKNGGTGRYE